MKRMKSTNLIIAIALTLTLAALSLIIPSSFAYAEKKQGGTTSGAEGKCKVTSGPNAGKTGTFTEGGQWCEGSWGGTECKDSSGKSNGKCTAAAQRRPLSSTPITKVSKK